MLPIRYYRVLARDGHWLFVLYPNGELYYTSGN